ncbi:unnamed protein product [Mytilus edulis]|uniref:DNA-directed DNA polymerase n=1 Tax=Mytilus edulis TaxID=6550 RepID=A0A8S3VN15_MYTED|nr:unnamed protein product [Mytilus edulis]
MLPVVGDKQQKLNGAANSTPDYEEESDTKRQNYIFFDFECTQDDLLECADGYQPGDSGCKNCGKAECGSYEHKPNLCVVHKVCLDCLNLEVTPLSECKTCGRNELIFRGINTTNKFCQWLFLETITELQFSVIISKDTTLSPSCNTYTRTVFSRRLFQAEPKNMSIEVPSCNIRMIDSINFLPMALSKLPKMFGIEELQKGYFPHLYNKKENQAVVLKHLPDVKFYNPDAMKLEDRETFLEWYQTNEKSIFDCSVELLKYCRSDVDILRRCCLKFRELFMSMTVSNAVDKGIDPFATCITIASACFWDTHSARTEWRREKIDQYRVDGYYETSNGEKVVLEYNGCFWHGCPKCYTQHTINTANNFAMSDLYHQTIEKKSHIEKKGYKYNCIWECEFDRNIRDDRNIKDSLTLSTLSLR